MSWRRKFGAWLVSFFDLPALTMSRINEAERQSMFRLGKQARQQLEAGRNLPQALLDKRTNPPVELPPPTIVPTSTPPLGARQRADWHKDIEAIKHTRSVPILSREEREKFARLHGRQLPQGGQP